MQPAPPSVADAALTTSLILEEQNELFDAYYARYRTSVEARRASLARPAEPSPSPSPPIGLARAPSMAAGVNLVEMLQTAKRINEPERRVLLEDTGDTRALRIPLIGGGAPRWEGSGGSAFTGMLKNFSPVLADGGNNALFVRGEFIEPGGGYDRLYGALNLLGDRSGEGGSTVLAHVAYRVDPAHDGGIKRAYVQGHKLGFWQTKSRFFTSDASAPLTAGRPFWWRIVAHPSGFASYVDGVLVHVSVPPPGKELRAGQELFVNLPITGDAGERATWRVHQLWWGSLPLDPIAAKQLAAIAGSSGALAATKVRATGVPAGASEADLRGAWAATLYQPVEVSAIEHGAATFTFASEEQVRRILGMQAGAGVAAGGALRVAVRGAVLTLSQVITRPGGGGAG